MLLLLFHVMSCKYVMLCHVMCYAGRVAAVPPAGPHLLPPGRPRDRGPEDGRQPRRLRRPLRQQGLLQQPQLQVECVTICLSFPASVCYLVPIWQLASDIRNEKAINGKSINSHNGIF